MAFILSDVPPKEFHWPVCTDWRSGWYRTLPMPVSIQSCECCPVFEDWYSMLCHIQCNHSPASLERTMAQYSIKSVSRSPPHFKWATTRIRFRASRHCVFSTLMCFLKERRGSHHSPRNFAESSIGRKVLPILIARGLRTLDRGAVKFMTLHLWDVNLKPFLVAHLCIAFTACCKFLFMVSRERPRKNRLSGHPQIVLWRVSGNTSGQPIDLQPESCQSEDPTSWNTLLWIEFVTEYGPNSDSDSAVPEIFRHENRQPASVNAAACPSAISISIFVRYFPHSIPYMVDGGIS